MLRRHVVAEGWWAPYAVELGVLNVVWDKLLPALEGKQMPLAADAAAHGGIARLGGGRH